MFIPEVKMHRGFVAMYNWVWVSFKDLFSVFILSQPLCTQLSSCLLFCFFSVTPCLPLFVFVNKLRKQLNLSSGTKTAENWSQTLYSHNFVFCDNRARFSIGHLLLYKFHSNSKKTPQKTQERAIERERERSWEGERDWERKRHQMNNFISCWQRVLEEWINFLMERLHAVFYQAFSCQSCWLIAAFGVVTIELNEPGNGCVTGSSNAMIRS